MYLNARSVASASPAAMQRAQPRRPSPRPARPAALGPAAAPVAAPPGSMIMIGRESLSAFGEIVIRPSRPEAAPAAQGAGARPTAGRLVANKNPLRRKAATHLPRRTAERHRAGTRTSARRRARRRRRRTARRLCRRRTRELAGIAGPGRGNKGWDAGGRREAGQKASGSCVLGGRLASRSPRFGWSCCSSRSFSACPSVRLPGRPHTAMH